MHPGASERSCGKCGPMHYRNLEAGERERKSEGMGEQWEKVNSGGCKCFC